MSGGFQQDSQINPYQSAPIEGTGSPNNFNAAKVQAPAIALIVFGSLCLLASVYGMVNALVSNPPPLPPDSPEFVRTMSQNTVGPVAATIQGFFIPVALFILFGAIQMLRLKTWGVALAASIVSMLNVGSCCCVLGLPLGIWALVILLSQDVKHAFAMNR